mmetsp:Transcript_29821/g.67452  ORF Transcript_29821/g.67452 Transcript_29821/m.67452 type:complete len:88 (-) Transcript_29821:277-540(-)
MEKWKPWRSETFSLAILFMSKCTKSSLATLSQGFVHLFAWRLSAHLTSFADEVAAPSSISLSFASCSALACLNFSLSLFLNSLIVFT